VKVLLKEKMEFRNHFKNGARPAKPKEQGLLIVYKRNGR
jgi:hypothetical protein